MNRSRMVFDALKNIEIEPKLQSNVEFRINLEKVLGCFDFYGETQDKFVFTFRPQSRPSDGLVEAFMKHSEHWKPQSVLLILDFEGYIDPDLVPDPWKVYFVEIIHIHAPDGCINKDDVTKLSSVIERVFNAKKRDKGGTYHPSEEKSNLISQHSRIGTKGCILSKRNKFIILGVTVLVIIIVSVVLSRFF